MGKSRKKSNVEVAPAAVSVPPAKSPKKGGKRDSEQVIDKSANTKKSKVDVVVAKQNGKKSKKAPIPEKKKPETSCSEDVTSSESEEEVKAPAKKSNKQVKPTVKEFSSSEDSSDEEMDEKVVVPAKKQLSTLAKNCSTGSTKKEQLKINSGSDSDSQDDDDDDAGDGDSDESSGDELPRDQKDEPKVESNRSSDSDGDSSKESEEESEDEPVKKTKKKDKDVKMDDAPSSATGKPTATKSEKKGLQTPAAGSQTQKSGSKTLFVGNLSYDVSEDDVMEFFKEAGEIVDVRLSQDADGRFRGFGHVEFADEAAAQKAIEMNGQELLGRSLKLDFAREKSAYTPNSSKDDSSYQKSGKGQSQTIFVRGFDNSQDMDQIESSLKEYFGSCGEITRVSLPRDYETGGSKGFAYMDFKDQNAFARALELNGTELGDCTLTVEEAKPRGDNRDGGSWSGGRGRGGRGRDSDGSRFGGRHGGGGRGGFGGRGRGRGGGRDRRN